MFVLFRVICQLYSSRCFELPVTGLGFSPPFASDALLNSAAAVNNDDILAGCSADYRLAIIPRKNSLTGLIIKIVIICLFILAIVKWYFATR